MKQHTKFLVVLGIVSSWASATQVTVVNDDPTGVGFNSTSNVATVPGNPGVTLGQQRQNAMNRAALIWSDWLGQQGANPPPLRVKVNMAPLPCAPSDYVLADAGPKEWIANFQSAPFANTLYPIALAEHLTNSNLQSSNSEEELRITVNSQIDANCAGSGLKFWYGLDPQAAVPVGQVSFLAMSLREIARGLGFSSQICLDPSGCGNKILSWPGGGYPNLKGQQYVDIWARYLFDVPQNKFWYQLTDGQRLASSMGGTSASLVWNGPSVAAVQPIIWPQAPGSGGLATLANSQQRIKMHAPSTLDAARSVKYFNILGSPRLLMMPDLLPATTQAPGIQGDLDLTPFLLKDIGWAVPDVSSIEITSGLTASVVGQPYQISVRVNGPSGSPNPTGSVTINDGAGSSCTTTVNPSGSCFLGSSSAGTRTITANYAGSALYRPSSITGSKVIDKASTSLFIPSISPSPGSVGQPITVTVNLSVQSPGAGTPTGSITVASGATTCSIVRPQNSCALTFTTAGAKSITAQYLGDANFLASNTATGTVTIVAPLPAVQNLRVAGFTCTGRAVGGYLWDAVAGAAFYQIEEQDDEMGPVVFTGSPNTPNTTSTSYLPLKVAPVMPSNIIFDVYLKVRACRSANDCSVWTPMVIYPQGGDQCG